MTDGNGLAFFASILGGEFELTANRGNILDVIQEGNIPVGTWHPSSMGGVVGNRGGGGAAINEEKPVSKQERHQFVHQASVRSGERALMIVHPGSIGNGVEHGVQGVGDFPRRHAGTKFFDLRGFIANRLHGQMQHDLVATSVGVLGDIGGVGMIRQNRQGQRVMQSENARNRCSVSPDIIEDNGQASAWKRRVSDMRDDVAFRGTIGVQNGVDGGFNFTATAEEDTDSQRAA
jgi:hypothetical protein